jgi:hypothetical protein
VGYHALSEERLLVRTRPGTMSLPLAMMLDFDETWCVWVRYGLSSSDVGMAVFSAIGYGYEG